MHLGEFIKIYRDERGLSMQAFADKCGLSKGYIAMLERNKNNKTGEPVVPSIETFVKVAAAMNMTLDEIAESVDENQPIGLSSTSKSYGTKIPIVSTVVAGMPADTYVDVLGYEEIGPDVASKGEHICLKVKGDSMSPVIQEGDLVIVRLQSDVESGDIAVVRINGEEATLKEIKKSEAGITLIGYNTAIYTPHFYSNEEIESLPVTIDGKVVEMKRSF